MPAPLLTAPRTSPVSPWRLRLLVSACGVALLFAAYGGWVFGALDGIAMGLLLAVVLGVWLQPSVAALLAWGFAGLFAVHHVPGDWLWAGTAFEYAILVTGIAWYSGRWVRRLDRTVAVDAVVSEPPSPAPRVPFLAPVLLAAAVLLGGAAIAAAVLGWSFAAALLGGVAAAAGARAVLTDRWRRQLFTRPQPAFEVRARFAEGRAAVYALDAEAGDEAVLTLRFPGQDSAPERPAELVGLPAPGAWCTLRIDGELCIPAGAAEPPGRAPRADSSSPTSIAR
jgi:hypothetical protein